MILYYEILLVRFIIIIIIISFVFRKNVFDFIFSWNVQTVAKSLTDLFICV